MPKDYSFTLPDSPSQSIRNRYKRERGDIVERNIELKLT
jgi:hypothetical protein